MAQSITLARPYARAAFELAHAAGTLTDWSRALAFAAEVAADPRVAGLAADPRVLPTQLVALHLPPGVAADAPFAHFLAELAEHHRLTLVPDVAVLFEAFKRDAESQLLVKVKSALALDAVQVEQLSTLHSTAVVERAGGATQVRSGSITVAPGDR